MENMENQEIIKKLAENFLARLELPKEKPTKPWALAIIGMVGAGRSEVAKRIVATMPGAVLLEPNSARYLLKEAGLSWGDNVRAILKIVGQKLLTNGFALVISGNAAEVEERKNLEEIVAPTGSSLRYLNIKIDPKIAEERTKNKYNNPSWISSFGEFRVNTTDKMVESIKQRAEFFAGLETKEIPGLVGEVDNNGTLEQLYKQVDEVVKRII